MNKDESEMSPRQCGWDDEAVFDFIDEALSPDRARLFEAHMRQCNACLSGVRAYRNLESSLRDLPSLEPRPGFDQSVLEAVLARPLPGGARVAAQRAGWLRAALNRPSPVRVTGAAALAGLGLVIAFAALQVSGAGNWREFAARMISGTVRGGVDLIFSGVGRLLTAVRISDAFINLAGVFETIYRSAAVAFHTVSAEFWLVSTLLSLLALMGAVRLATGSAVERGIGRVRFVL